MTSIKTAAIGMAALLMSCTAYTAHAGNLVTNGSFESTSLSGKDYFAGNVTGWSNTRLLTFLDFPGTADNGSFLSVYKGMAATSPDGGNFVEADGDPVFRSAISQTIHGLTIGKSYTLTFFQAAGQQVKYKGPTTERWDVTFGGETQYSDKYSLAQGATGAWQSQSMTFVANATSEVLSFLAAGTPNGAPPISFLDGVNLQASSVPEPATLALLGVGLLGTAAFKRKSKNRA